MADNKERKSKTVFFQLYNPNHKDDILKLLENAVPFPIVDESDLPLGDDEFQMFSTRKNNSSFVNEGSSTLPVISGLSCSTCDAAFSSLEEQRQHFKLDWHRYNVKRREYEQQPIAEAEFLEIVDGLSSISGSESEDEAVNSNTSDQLSPGVEKISFTSDSGLPQHTSADQVLMNYLLNVSRSTKTFFENDKDEVFAIHPSILTPSNQLHHSKENDAADVPSVDSIREIISSPRKLGIVMLSGGHFAAGIFEGITEVRHKTIHRYTVRGESQDNSGGSRPTSAGGSLRRHKELDLTQEIQTLIKTWEEDFEQCQWIFYRASGSSQKTLFEGISSSVFTNTNPRLRSIPFQTKRPTFREVKRVMTEITSIEVYRAEDFMNKFLPGPPSPQGSPNESEDLSGEKPKKTPWLSMFPYPGFSI